MFFPRRISTTLKLKIALAALGAALMLTNTASAEAITTGILKISQPYVRAMVPGAPVGGGYLTITNTGSTDARLAAASSPRAGTVHNCHF
jgi:copper(I)-binding protein